MLGMNQDKAKMIMEVEELYKRSSLQQRLNCVIQLIDMEYWKGILQQKAQIKNNKI